MSAAVRAISKELTDTFTRLVADVPTFEVLSPEVLPYGLKPHTRSICWLAEQVILQNVRKRQDAYGLDGYADPDSDISAWDAKLTYKAIPDRACYVNIKVSDVTRPIRRNDIASVKKLQSFYNEEPDALLFYVVIMLQFDGNKIHFRGSPIIRHYPWIGDFVVNVRNHHIQCIYEVPVIERSTSAFLELVGERAARLRNR